MSEQPEQKSNLKNTVVGVVTLFVIIIGIMSLGDGGGNNNTPTPVANEIQNTNIPSAEDQKPVQEAQAEPKTSSPLIPDSSKTAPTLTPETSPAPEPQTDRASVLAILKANASTKWGDDYQMVQYEYNQQVAAYDWVVAQTKYPSIMTKAKQKWGNDYTMVKYEYGQQTAAYEWVIAQTEYPDIMAKAKVKWGDDYSMVKYEYENQVKAYQGL